MNSANGRIEMPNNLNEFEVSHDAGQTENRTRSTSARTDAKDNLDYEGYKRQLNVSFKDFQLTVNDGTLTSGNDKTYLKSPNGSSSQGKLENVFFLFPKNRDFGEADEFHETHRVLGGEKEVSYNLANAHIDDRGRLASRTPLPNKSEGGAFLNYDDSTRQFRFAKGSNSTSYLASTGLNFQENIKELVVYDSTMYRIKLNNFWYNNNVTVHIRKVNGGPLPAAKGQPLLLTPLTVRFFGNRLACWAPQVITSEDNE